MAKQIEQLQNFSDEQIRATASSHSAPIYLYSLSALDRQIEELKNWRMPFGQTLRFAMKANPHPAILEHLNSQDIWIDASSGPEAEAATAAGVTAERIMLTTQQLPDNLSELLDLGVNFNACSIRQLERFCRLKPGGELSLRINPGIGSGANNRLTTGGVNAAFGIWHEYIDQAKQIAADAGVDIAQIHTHVGSGSAPEPWLETARLNLELLHEFPDVERLSLGGGFKFGRMAKQPTLDIAEASEQVGRLVEQFAEDTGRRLHIEIEPGTYFVAPIATLVTQVIDVKDTGKDGRNFAIINSGMNDLLRPAMYGAQHPLVTVASDGGEREVGQLVVAGHCCESSDVFTVAPSHPEQLEPRAMALPEIGDYICVEGVGAYGATMRPVMYNSFEPAKEVFVS